MLYLHVTTSCFTHYSLLSRLSTAPVGGLTGWFRLDFNNNNVAYYNGVLNGCYTSMEYTFGAGCSVDEMVAHSISAQCDEREEVQNLEYEIEAGCIGFQFSIQTDEFPEDSKLVLSDARGFMLWDDRPWTQQDAGGFFDLDICLNPMGCYNFTLMDSQTHSDGLTSAPDGGTPGYFNVSFGREWLDSYDGARDGFFSSKWYMFGDGCPHDEVMTQGTVGADRNIFTEQSSSGTADSGCKEFTFNIDFDEFPEDVILSLEYSNGTAIWESLRPWNQQHLGESVSETLCLDPQSCYSFTVEDSYGDGLTDETVHGPGTFSVAWGNQLLDSYRGQECYASKWYNFGDLCPFTMGSLGKTCRQQENIFALQSQEDCTDFTFHIEADLYPGDITFSLVDSDKWSVWATETLEESTTKTECLPHAECYTFTIEDSFTDGLTKGTPGKFHLDYAGERIGSYRASTDGCFSNQMFTFGHGCPSFPEVVVVSEVRTSGDCRDDNR